MAEIDPELIERALRWCAEAGRQTTAATVTSALAPLSWDELLAARALLADPPPLRPLGPFALADIARGAPADVAAERERGGRYVAESIPGPTETPVRAPSGRRKKARASYVVRRSGARTAAGAPPPRALPLLDELLLEEGRAVMERLLRRHGGRRARLVAALADGWRRADGRPLDGDDLDRTLARHGMSRAFGNRERDEILHALRAAGGVRARAAVSLGLDLPSLDEALDRLGAREEAERLREERRRALRARGTLTHRSHLLLDDTERLADLGLVEEFSRDLAHRLPGHVRALTATSADPAPALLARSLSLTQDAIERLLQLTGLSLERLPRTAHPSPPPPGRAQAPGRPGGAAMARAGAPRAPGSGRKEGRRTGPARGPRGGGAPRTRPPRGSGGARPGGRSRPPSRKPRSR